MIVGRLSPVELGRFVAVPPGDRARARLVVSPWLPPAIDAITLGRCIVVRRGLERDRALLTHELVHVRQWRELGRARFLARYLGPYARGRLRGLGHRDAYEAIPLEVEARAVAGR
ncbi:MAG TPA: DUF4157 domain-containing protein [Acidimicrobiia bacterium]|nr:DUF4157 domain-containing protein [Acidimicrobiia bacterium]